MEDCENFLCLFNRLKSEIFREATEYKNSFLSELKNLEEFEELEKNEIEKIKKDEKNYFEEILDRLDKKLKDEDNIRDLLLDEINLFSQKNAKIESLKNRTLAEIAKKSIFNRLGVDFGIGFLKPEEVRKAEDFYKNLKKVNDFYKEEIEKKAEMYEKWLGSYKEEKTKSPETT